MRSRIFLPLMALLLFACKKDDTVPPPPPSTPSYEMEFIVMNDTLPLEGAVVGIAFQGQDCADGIFSQQGTTNAQGKISFPFTQRDDVCYEVAATVGGVVRTQSGTTAWTSGYYYSKTIVF